MIEARILNYLKDKLDVPVVMEVPRDMPDRFVLVEKTGSRIRNHISGATLAIQSWDKGSLYQAAVLNGRVKAAMDDAVELKNVSSVKLNSDYNYTDPDVKMYRYQAVFDLVYIEVSGGYEDE